MVFFLLIQFYLTHVQLYEQINFSGDMSIGAVDSAILTVCSTDIFDPCYKCYRLKWSHLCASMSLCSNTRYPTTLPYHPNLDLTFMKTSRNTQNCDRQQSPLKLSKGIHTWLSLLLSKNLWPYLHYTLANVN